jgi:hypothetical protein
VVKETEEAKDEEVKKINDLAISLCQIYQRPKGAVQVVVQHNASIVFTRLHLLHTCSRSTHFHRSLRQ